MSVSVEEYVYRYQSLIAGLLALLAALLTVAAMIWIDRRQSRRHAETIEIIRRPIVSDIESAEAAVIIIRGIIRNYGERLIDYMEEDKVNSAKNEAMSMIKLKKEFAKSLVFQRASSTNGEIAGHLTNVNYLARDLDNRFVKKISIENLDNAKEYFLKYINEIEHQCQKIEEKIKTLR